MSHPQAPAAQHHSGIYTGFTPVPAAFAELPTPAMGLQSMSTESESFTSEDRLLLKLIYYQQQSIQAQLNSILSWAQQTNTRLAVLEGRGTDAQFGPPRGALPRQDPPGPSWQAQRTQQSPVWTAGNNANTQNVSVTSCNNTMFEQRSCTPPGASPTESGRGREAIGSQQRHAGTRGVQNQSIESIAATWDPRSKDAAVRPASRNSVAGDASFRSSRASHLGFGENPLLHSRHSSQVSAVGGPGLAQTSDLSLSAAVDASRLSRPASRLPSAQHSSLLSGGVDGRADAHAQGSHEDPSRPPWRPAAAVAAPNSHTVPLVSPPTGQRHVSDPSAVVVMAERDVPAYRRVPSSPAVAPPPPPTHNSITLNPSMPARSDDPGLASRATPGNSPHTTRGQTVTNATPPVAPQTGSPPSREQTLSGSVGVGGDHPRNPVVRTHRDYGDMDSLSDGYGSYESRQYIQSIGLL